MHNYGLFAGPYDDVWCRLSMVDLKLMYLFVVVGVRTKKFGYTGTGEQKKK